MSAIGPGDFVECIDASPATRGRKHGLVEGCMYTVTWVGENPGTGNSCIRLKEITYPWVHKAQGYALRRFRPIYRPKPDAFTDLLKIPTMEDA